MTDLAHYASEHKIEFPLLKDAGNVIADQMGAVRTPEVFVLDADRVVRYWGRIDDQFGFQDKGVAFQRDAPTQRDLADGARRSAGRQAGHDRRGSPARVAASAAFASPWPTAT